MPQSEVNGKYFNPLFSIFIYLATYLSVIVVYKINIMSLGKKDYRQIRAVCWFTAMLITTKAAGVLYQDSHSISEG